MIDIVAHTMEYDGIGVESSIKLEPYADHFFDIYKKIYDDCFREMRIALDLEPINCCDTRESLYKKRSDIFLYFKNNIMIGSVAIHENEIDDLIVAKGYQRKGYGELLLKFAVHRMQHKNISPIVLRVADWNRGAMNLYLKNEFKIIKTETIRRL